jgi:hypothetical protein
VAGERALPGRIVAVTSRWEPGEVVVRREVLGHAPGFHPPQRPDWYGRPWLGVPVHVVADTGDQLVTYIGEGAEIACVEGDWPTPDGLHPWHHKSRWQGHGCLMVQRPGDHHAVWHFWDGPDREFRCWYVNLQVDALRTPIGYDTQDLELDFLVFPDGGWEVKDLELLDDRVAEGRFTSGLVGWIRDLGERLAGDLDAGRHWWSHEWAEWSPPADWRDADLPAGWASAR